MLTCRCLLLALLWLGAFVLDAASSKFAAEFCAMLAARKTLLTSPAAAIAGQCKDSEPETGILHCQRQLMWWHGHEPESVCAAMPTARMLAIRRRYRFTWQCDVQLPPGSPFGGKLSLPALTMTLLR